MVGLVISFPQMVLVYKAGEKKFDIKDIQIIVPEMQPLFPPAPGGAKGPASGAAQQEGAEDALERAFGGGSGTPGQDKGSNTPVSPGGAAVAPADGSSAGAAAPGVSEQDDDARALERALREQMPDTGKESKAPK